jgi:hypothetical protein
MSAFACVGLALGLGVATRSLSICRHWGTESVVVMVPMMRVCGKRAVLAGKQMLGDDTTDDSRAADQICIR